MVEGRSPPARADLPGTVAFWNQADTVRPYLKQVARCLLGAELAAKLDPSDVVQQAFLNAHRRASQFQGQNFAAWLGWLTAIVRNETLHAVRYYQRDARDVGREHPLPAGTETVCRPPA